MKRFFEKVADVIENKMIEANLVVKNEVERAGRILAGEEGSLVETIIIVAILAGAAVAVMVTLGGAIQEKGNEAKDIIQSASF